MKIINDIFNGVDPIPESIRVILFQEYFKFYE